MHIEEKFYFHSGNLRLAGILGYPETGQPKRAVLLCGPHPNFAGNMENNVVRALFDAFAENSVVLRFNYRGIGESEIELSDEVSKYDYWNEVEEQKSYTDIVGDVKAAFAALHEVDSRIPIHIIGYSFGAIVGLLAGLQIAGFKGRMAGIAPPLLRYSFDFLRPCPVPCLLLSGRNDFVFTTDVNQGAAYWPVTVSQQVLEDEDHFFRQREVKVVEPVSAFLDVHV